MREIFFRTLGNGKVKGKGKSSIPHLNGDTLKLRLRFFRSLLAESSLAEGIRAERAEEINLSKIGPIRLAEIEL